MLLFDGSSDCRVAMGSIGCMRRLVSYMLLTLTGLLFIFACREMILLAGIILSPAGWDEHAFWGRTYNLFIALEFVFMIIKYFEENYHFPLRYILYIGITSVTRAMIIDHDNLIACGMSILLMVLAYCLATLRNALAVRYLPDELGAV